MEAHYFRFTIYDLRGVREPRPPIVQLKISFFVGDEVTSLKYLPFLKDKLETPYVVSYFFNRPPQVEWELASGDQKVRDVILHKPNFSNLI
jgi:hypothetical protein